MRSLKLKTILLAGTFAAFGMVTSAFATEGYFLNGVGAKSKGLAGADIARANDSMGASLNPAGIVGIDSQISVGASLFNPVRGYTGTTSPGAGAFTPDGEVDSGQKYFPVPAIGYVRALGPNSAFALTINGNGGMNTSYDQPFTRNVGFPCSGTFCGGKAGVTLNQLYVSATYATKLGDKLAVGISPMYALQGFKAQGLGAFAGVSSNPTKLTDNHTDYSHGWGVKLGVQYNLTPALALGAAYQPKMNMSEFKDYTGLFADKGDFDIPENYSVGLAYQASPKANLMFAYRHISYSDVNAVGNSTTTPLPFGFANGPGFGWDDVDTYKFGVEYNFNEKITLRGGVSYNNNPVGSEDVTLNILAPGVQTTHFTGGLSYNLSPANSLDFALVYSPKSKVTGIEVTPMGPNPYHSIELHMYQLEATVSYVHKFGK